jgi:hypothetical protein
MPDYVLPAGAVQNPPGKPGTGAEAHSWVERMVTYAEKGAALVYHDVLAAQRDVTKWMDNNPQVAALMGKGAQYVVSLLAADGLPTSNIFLIATTVEAGLKALAAADPTVQSGSSVKAPN